jgi:imidazolonepropionase-like amidohydrolase
MDKVRYIKAGTFIDGSGGEVHRDVFLAVQGGIISNIGPAKDLPSHDGAVIDDFPHCTIVPPFVDCSVSLSQSPSVDPKVQTAAAEAGPAEKAALFTQHVRYCHSHGVLGVAETNINGPDEELQELMEPGNAIDIQTAGTDFLRIVYSDIGTQVTGASLNREDRGPMLQQKAEKKVVVVANGGQQVQEALAAGCDAIEQGYGMGEDNLRQMADMDVLWIPGVILAQNGLQGAASGGDVMCRFSMRYVAPGKADPGAEAYWKRMLTGQLEQLRMARELGVKTAVGTGAGRVGILHGESMVEEIKLFIRAGYSLAQAIRCASVNGAGFFNMDNLGALAVGHPATFLLARGTVQQLPRKLNYLEGIYVEGVQSMAF